LPRLALFAAIEFLHMNICVLFKITYGFVYSIVQRYIIQNNLQNIEYTPEEIETMMNDANEYELAQIREYAQRLARGEA
jgi:hypothetical protein